jgi:hypothetical protein
MLSTAPPGVAATPNSTVNTGAKGGGGEGVPSVVPSMLLFSVLCHKSEVSSGAACTCSHTSDMATTLLDTTDARTHTHTHTHTHTPPPPRQRYSRKWTKQTDARAMARVSL